MSDVAIRVEKLGKRYRLGQRQPYKTLRETLTAPFRRRADASTLPGSADHIWALQDVSLEVKHGEVIGLIGSNGAGKSTLLKILSRITEPTCGTADVYGRVGSLLEVGTGFHPELTGRENIYFNGSILGMRKAEIARRFDEIVAFAEVEKFIDTPVKHYSSGMHVRLAFAVAAHLEPEILLVDEVLAVGDAAFQRKCLNKMGDVAQGGRTIVFVSHNLTAVRRLCQTVIWLDGGTVRAQGATVPTTEKYLQTTLESSASSLETAPRRRVDRPGVRFVECRVVANDRSARTVVRYGDSLTLRAHFVSDIVAERVVVAVNINTLDGMLIQNSNTAMVGQPVSLQPGRGWLECTFENIRLAPSQYSITLAVCDPGGQYFDWIDNAAVVQVVDDPQMGTAMPVDSSCGLVWFPVRFATGAGARGDE